VDCTEHSFNFDREGAAPSSIRPGGSGGGVPFYRTYQCGDGEWLFLAALTPRFTEIAFEVLGATWVLHDERLGGRGRAAMLMPEHSLWAIKEIAAVFATKPRAEWLALLAAAGCPAGPLLQRDDWLDHPQLDAIGMRVVVDDPERGEVVMPGVPVRLTASPGAVRGPAPRLASATIDAILREWSSSTREGTIGTTGSPAARAANGPLDGVRVLDLGAIIAGPFGASLLAELGADVIKVEPLTGDSFRGPGFAAYNKGQRGVALDLQSADGRDALLALVRTADAVIDNYRPGVLGRLRLTYDDLREVNPDIITLSVTGFGEGGALGNEPGFDPVLQAMSGMMLAQGGAGDPVFFTVPVDDVAAAASAALGICLALVHRGRGGGGQRLWTSLAGMAAVLQAGELVRFDGRPPAPVGGSDFPGPSPANRYFRAVDGWVRVQAGPQQEGGGIAHSRRGAGAQSRGLGGAPCRCRHSRCAGAARLRAFDRGRHRRGGRIRPRPATRPRVMADVRSSRPVLPYPAHRHVDRTCAR